MKVTLLKNKGFTLTEIMLTLAIVGLITLMAIPTMNNYIVQSKIADAVQTTSAVQSLVAEQISARESVTDSGVGLTLPTTLGRYVQSFSVNANGAINLITTSSANSIGLTITPNFNATNQEIAWTCAVTNAEFNPLVPDECRI